MRTQLGVNATNADIVTDLHDPQLLHPLIAGATELAQEDLNKTDWIAVDDTSTGTTKKVTLASLLKWVHSMSYYTLGSVVHLASFDWIVFDVDYDNGYVTLGLCDCYGQTRFSQDNDPDGSATCNKYANSKLLDQVRAFQTELYGGSPGSNAGILYGHVEQLVRMDDIEGVGSADDPMYVFIPTYDMMMNQFALSKINRYSGWTNWGSHGNRIARAGDGAGNVDLTNTRCMPRNRMGWWLSTPAVYQGSPRVCSVGHHGNIGSSAMPTEELGFRPFVRIRA